MKIIKIGETTLFDVTSNDSRSKLDVGRIGGVIGSLMHDLSVMMDPI